MGLVALPDLAGVWEENSPADQAATRETSPEAWCLLNCHVYIAPSGRGVKKINHLLGDTATRPHPQRSVRGGGGVKRQRDRQASSATGFCRPSVHSATVPRERTGSTGQAGNLPPGAELPVQPKVKVSPTKSGSQPHPHLLVCSVTGFYPGGIEIKWLKNGQEQTAGVVSTELLQNGDWTFQILVMLEMSPRRGDVYTCQVEHVSLRGPLAVHWEAQSDSARSKRLTGVGAFVLGLIVPAPGLLTCPRTKKDYVFYDF
ncbi:HLA class II histocompatibility antigen, DP beta 1 chain-like [Mauremys mutica]|uniref:HLA class II histocompatibility antigen, DP beta 1 chain-like n=1 Tax=Mauremys mutica TaxID=74926 RepID=UPI001D167A86|nr:HLA class II histocompatibility antigen, DP beta 1 chain-like [Mauremys mutica]